MDSSQGCTTIFPCKKARFQLHRSFAIGVIVFLAAQMPIGAYMWLNLGPFQGGFRGKGTFSSDWEQGVLTDSRLPPAAEVIALTADKIEVPEVPIQWIEWRSRLGEPVLVVTSSRDQVGHAFTTRGRALERLAPGEAGEIARDQVRGLPPFRFQEETTYYGSDLNRRIPAYKFRFEDRRSSDVFVCTTTGDVISRRTDFWRLFGPFLRLHMFAWTQNKVIDTILLIVFQLGLLGLIVSGWRLHFAAPVRRIETPRNESSG